MTEFAFDPKDATAKAGKVTITAGRGRNRRAADGSERCGRSWTSSATTG
jgi:hypothetical protein